MKEAFSVTFLCSTQQSDSHYRLQERENHTECLKVRRILAQPTHQGVNREQLLLSTAAQGLHTVNTQSILSQHRVNIYSPHTKVSTENSSFSPLLHRACTQSTHSHYLVNTQATHSQYIVNIYSPHPRVSKENSSFSLLLHSTCTLSTHSQHCQQTVNT